MLVVFPQSGWVWGMGHLWGNLCAVVWHWDVVESKYKLCGPKVEESRLSRACRFLHLKGVLHPIFELSGLDIFASEKEPIISAFSKPALDRIHILNTMWKFLIQHNL